METPRLPMRVARVDPAARNRDSGRVVGGGGPRSGPEVPGGPAAAGGRAGKTARARGDDLRERGVRARASSVTDAAVTDLAPTIGVRAACHAVGAAQAGYYRRHRISPAPPRPTPIPQRDRSQPRALTEHEQHKILEVLHSPRFVDVAPAEVWATLLDEGVY